MGARPAKLESYRSAEVAESYDRRWGDAAGMRRQRRKARALERALTVLESAAGGRLRGVLDAPCGTARFTLLLRERCSGYVGLDLSLSMLAAARAKDVDARWLSGDLARLPFEDDAFDAAVCIRFLHLVRDSSARAAFLRELRRVTRIGAVVDFRHRHTLRVQSRKLRYRLGLRDRPPSNPSRADIRREIDAAGWRHSRWITVHHAPWLSDKVLIAATA